MNGWHKRANMASTLLYSSLSHFLTSPWTLRSAAGRPNESAANSATGVPSTGPLRRKRIRKCRDRKVETHIAGSCPGTTPIHHLTDSGSSSSSCCHSHCADGEHLLECYGGSCKDCAASDDHCIGVHPFAIVGTGHVVPISILRSTFMRILANVFTLHM